MIKYGNAIIIAASIFTILFSGVTIYNVSQITKSLEQIK